MEEDAGGAELTEEAVTATAGLVCRVLVETAEEVAEETVEEVSMEEIIEEVGGEAVEAGEETLVEGVVEQMIVEAKDQACRVETAEAVEEILEAEEAGRGVTLEGVETLEEVETAEVVPATEEGAPPRLRLRVIHTLSRLPLVQSSTESRRSHRSKAKQQQNGCRTEEL